jgi:hypothetical protein
MDILIIALLVATTLFSFFTSILIVQLAVKLISDFTPTFGIALKAGILAILANFIFYGFMKYILSVPVDQFSVKIFCTAIYFFIPAGIYGRLIKHPESGPIGFYKACLVNLVYYFIVAVIAGLIYFLTYIIKIMLK